MGCLLARKLVEKGVTCVEVDLGGWDNHANIFNAIKNGTGRRAGQGHGRPGQGSGGPRHVEEHGGAVDGRVRPHAAHQPEQRPRSLGAVLVGRALGGGAIQGGQVFGSTSKDGTDVKDKPASIGDLFATRLQGHGPRPGTKVRDNLGRPLDIAEGKPLKGFV